MGRLAALAASNHQPPPPRRMAGVGCWLAEPPSPLLRADVVGEVGGLLDSEQAANGEATTNPDRNKSRRERPSRFMPDLTDGDTRPIEIRARSNARVSPAPSFARGAHAPQQGP